MCVRGIVFSGPLPLGETSCVEQPMAPVCNSLLPNPSVISDLRGHCRMEAAGNPGPENTQLARIPLRGVVSPEKQRQVAA